MMSTATPHDEERHQRLAAIAQLEQQHKLRRACMIQNGQSDPLSSRTGKYFVLLVSKGSGNLEQRANQDRAETILHEYPHEIIDGSNYAMSAKRDELFELSSTRGNYPQLFLVDHGEYTFVGTFDMIEYHNDQGTLGSLLEESQPKSPKKKTSIVMSVKGLLKSSTKKISAELASPSKSTNRKKSTEPLGKTGMSNLDHTSTRSIEMDNISPAKKDKSSKMKHNRRSSFGDNEKTPFLLEEDDVPIKPASTGRLLISKSEGDMPLLDDNNCKEKSKGEHRSRSAGQRKEMKRGNSKGKLLRTDEDGDDLQTNSSKSQKPRSRSKSESKYKHKEKVKGDDEIQSDDVQDTSLLKSSKHRSSSRNGLRDSTRSAKNGVEGESKKSSRSSSRGKLRDAMKESRGGENEERKKSKDDGEMELKEEGDNDDDSETNAKRSKSLSKRSMRLVDSEPKEGGEQEGDGMETKPKPRKSRSKGQLMAKDGDDTTMDKNSPVKPRSKLWLREQDGEKHPTARRRNGHSASPHKLRERTIVRSNSPGTYRGDIARKREAMKEFREKKSLKTLDLGDSSSEVEKKPRKHQSAGTLDVTGSSLLSSPRRHQSLLNVKTREKNPEEINESLHDLVKRVKDKEKREKIDEEDADDEKQQADSRLSSVQW